MKAMSSDEPVAGKEIADRDPLLLAGSENFVGTVSHAVHHHRLFRARKMLPKVLLDCKIHGSLHLHALDI